ncbi:hypothetical protein VNO77_19395 [Canavalia gladiata]|uniref:Uncharacterized protein n=1 Tax=Canavalia gladiata TaxID=3824 RepID=A0AAN9QKF7_CANGL
MAHKPSYNPHANHHKGFSMITNGAPNVPLNQHQPLTTFKVSTSSPPVQSIPSKILGFPSEVACHPLVAGSIPKSKIAMRELRPSMSEAKKVDSFRLESRREEFSLLLLLTTVVMEAKEEQGITWLELSQLILEHDSLDTRTRWRLRSRNGPWAQIMCSYSRSWSGMLEHEVTGYPHGPGFPLGHDIPENPLDPPNKHMDACILLVSYYCSATFVTTLHEDKQQHILSMAYLSLLSRELFHGFTTHLAFDCQKVCTADDLKPPECPSHCLACIQQWRLTPGPFTTTLAFPCRGMVTESSIAKAIWP